MLKDRIKSSRKAAGLTQEALAKKIGIQRAAVTQWETGASMSIEGKNLLKAASVLGVSANWLANGKGDKTGGVELDSGLVEKLKLLPPSLIGVLDQMIDGLLEVVEAGDLGDYGRNPRQSAKHQNSSKSQPE